MSGGFGGCCLVGENAGFLGKDDGLVGEDVGLV